MFITKGYREEGYTFDKLLGSGAYGAVWSATDKNGDKVAIKIFNDEEYMSDELDVLDEVTQSELCEWSICLKNTYHSDGLTRIVTDLVQGESMTEYIKSTTMAERNDDYNPFRLVLGLDYIHKKGIAHTDIKSDNIQRRSSDGKFIFLDWGLGCLRKHCTEKGNDYDCTRIENCIGSGTEYTMPPGYDFGFQNYNYGNLSDNFSHDIWSLGVILYYFYRLQKGVTPADIPKMQYMYKLRYDQIEFNISKLSNQIAREILPLMLVKESAERLKNWPKVVKIVSDYLDCFKERGYDIK